ncbi:26S proteasome non-ATPase regulatory subunit 8 [Armadillidium vulgare]|nr:26S proteasome non-ATPase regulatory subunit 8 [Armadillidium vulgare]
MSSTSRSAVLKSVVSVYEKLKSEWSKKPKNLELCGKYLSEIKVELTKLRFLPSTGKSVSKEELLVANISLWFCINDFDVNYELLGLDLLCLLAQNKVGEFHTALEHLPPSVVSENVYIRHPVAMEQYLMEGAYNKIYLAKGEVPAEGYKFFIEELLSTIREDIADCVENAYEKIKPEDIGKMLYLGNTSEILNLLQTEKLINTVSLQRGWEVGSDGYLQFVKEVRKHDESVPSQDLASQMINYAREMEQIV